MKKVLGIFLVVILSAFGMAADAAKRYKIDLLHSTTVTMTGVSSGGYFVKAWAVAKNADKAMEQARIDAVLAALKTGINADMAAEGAGVANLPALMTAEEFDKHFMEIGDFLSAGGFLDFVKDVSSTYPKGADNVKTPNGRKVGLSMVLDYAGLRSELQKRGWIKGLNDHFEYKGN